MQAFEGTYIGSRCHTAYTKYEIDPITHQFHRAWVLPIATQKAYLRCRNFVAMDGIHMKDLYCMTILALVILDGNNQIVPLSWASVPTEDYENWRWFLRKVARYIPLEKEDSMIISDRGKGLVAAVDEIYPNAVHGYCCQHFTENVEAHGFSKECKRLFWYAAFAESKVAFDTIFVKIKVEDPNCYDYLRNVPAEQWVSYAFSRPRYGHLISNIQESVNSLWLKTWNQPVLHCLRICHEFYVFPSEETAPYQTVDRCCLELNQRSLEKRTERYCQLIYSASCTYSTF